MTKTDMPILSDDLKQLITHIAPGSAAADNLANIINNIMLISEHSSELLNSVAAIKGLLPGLEHFTEGFLLSQQQIPPNEDTLKLVAELSAIASLVYHSEQMEKTIESIKHYSDEIIKVPLKSERSLKQSELDNLFKLPEINR